MGWQGLRMGREGTVLPRCWQPGLYVGKSFFPAHLCSCTPALACRPWVGWAEPETPGIRGPASPGGVWDGVSRVCKGECVGL